MDEALLLALTSLFVFGWARDFFEERFDEALSIIEESESYSPTDKWVDQYDLPPSRSGVKI